MLGSVLLCGYPHRRRIQGSPGSQEFSLSVGAPHALNSTVRVLEALNWPHRTAFHAPGGRMKRWLVLVLAVAVIAPTFGSAQAGPRRRAERRAERRVTRRVVRHRTVIVVGHGWPLRRPLRQVWVHPARVPVRMGPRVFLATAVFTGVAVAEI